jgi:hypothetical protein
VFHICGLALHMWCTFLLVCFTVSCRHVSTCVNVWAFFSFIGMSSWIRSFSKSIEFANRIEYFTCLFTISLLSTGQFPHWVCARTYYGQNGQPNKIPRLYQNKYPQPTTTHRAHGADQNFFHTSKRTCKKRAVINLNEDKRTTSSSTECLNTQQFRWKEIGQSANRFVPCGNHHEFHFHFILTLQTDRW